MRLIDADDLTDRLETFMEWENATFVQHEIDASPTIDPVKHGRWIFEEHLAGYYHWECSNCKAWFSDNARFGYYYCPNCGAKMDGEEQHENNTD